MKHRMFPLLCAGLCLLFAGCAEKETPPPADIPTAPISTPAPTEAPAETAVPVETAAPTAAAQETAVFLPVPGVYTYSAEDALWTLTLRDSGPYTLQKEGDIPHTGESWAVNEDGTVSCGPTDLWNEAFADGYGCSTWTLFPDGRCEPVISG